MLTAYERAIDLADIIEYRRNRAAISENNAYDMLYDAGMCVPRRNLQRFLLLIDCTDDISY